MRFFDNYVRFFFCLLLSGRPPKSYSNSQILKKNVHHIINKSGRFCFYSTQELNETLQNRLAELQQSDSTLSEVNEVKNNPGAYLFQLDSEKIQG